MEAKAGGSKREDVVQSFRKMDVADEVCGRKKEKARHRQTWWSNDKVAELISEKDICLEFLTNPKILCIGK